LFQLTYKDSPVRPFFAEIGTVGFYFASKPLSGPARLENRASAVGGTHAQYGFLFAIARSFLQK
jgi:hypothetical protein